MKKTTPPSKGVSRKAKKSATEKPVRGQPTKYRPEYAQQLIDHFNVEVSRTVMKVITTKSGSTIEEPMEVANDLPVLEDFARKVKVTVRTLQNWAKTFPEFEDAYEIAMDSQRRMVLVNGMSGRYAQPFACLFARTKMNFVERVEVSGKDGGAIEGEFTVVDETANRMKALMARMGLIPAAIGGPA